MVLAMVIAAGCDGEAATLVVQVRTDLLPGQELAAVEVAIEGEVGVTRVDASTARDWGLGVRVLERAVARGTHRLRVAAVDAAGATVVERPVRVTVDGGGVRVVTVLLTRDCQGVTCPGAGDPAAIACLGGRCVEDGCVEEDAAACGARACATAADCAPVAGACATVECSASGACFAAPDHAACAAGEVCSTTLDCMETSCSEWSMELPSGGVLPQIGPRITASVGGLHVVWSPIESLVLPAVRSARLDLGGMPASPPLDLVQSRVIDARVGAWPGGATLTASDEAAALVIQPLDPSGAFVGTQTTLNLLSQAGPYDAASSGSYDAVAWTDDATGTQQVLYHVAPRDGASGVFGRVSPDPSLAVMGSLVFASDAFIAVYTDALAGPVDIRAGRIGERSSAPLDDRLLIPDLGTAVVLDAAYGGAHLGVAYAAEDGVVRFASFTARLEPVAAPVVVGGLAGTSGVAVAFDGTAFGIVWLDARAAFHFARVTGEGTVLALERLVDPGADVSSSIDMTAAGGSFYVAFHASTGLFHLWLSRICP